MRTLSIRVRNWCAPWAYASVPDAHAQHAHQFSYFSNVHFVYPQHARKELMRALSMRFRNWCTCWHACQELMHTLSLQVRNWCMHWAYASGTNACTECIPFIKCWAYAPGTDAYPEYKGQELMRMLSMRISSWLVSSACAPVSYAYAQHKHRNSKFERGPYKPCWAYAWVPYAYAQHARQKLNAA